MPRIGLPDIHGQFKFDTGTATDPSMAFREDTDTGIYTDTDNTLSFSTDGTRRFSILPDGSLEFVDISAPGVTTNKLYAVGGNLFFNGTQVDSSGGISNVVEDTSPELGGALNTNGKAITRTSAGTLSITGYGFGTAGGNINIQGGDGSTSGGDINLIPGEDWTDNTADGVIQIQPKAGAGAPAVHFFQDSGTTKYMGLKAPASVTTSRTLTLPDGVGVAGQALITDGNDPAILSWSSFVTNPMTADLDVGSFDIVSADGSSPPEVRIKVGTATSGSSSPSTALVQGGYVGTGSTAFTAGTVQILGGHNQGTTGTRLGGNAKVTAGNATATSGTGQGGTVEIAAGQGNTAGGPMTIYGGDVSGTAGIGGAITIKSGEGGSSSGDGGATKIYGGDSTASGTYGGEVIIKGGQGIAYGGHVKIYSGDSATGGAGDIILKPSNGDGIPGYIYIEPPQALAPPSQMRFRENSTNGTNWMAIRAPAAITGNRILELPDGTGITGQVLTTSVAGSVGTLAWGMYLFTGAGSPEGVVVAPPGALYTDTNGGAGTTLYVKESTIGNTGWVAK